MPHRQYWRSLGQGEILRAMSQENVELAHRANDAFNRHDFDALLALIDPNIEFTSRIVELEGGGPFRGHDGIKEWWANLFGVFPEFSSKIEEVRDLGDLTLARMRQHSQGMEKDSPADQTQWHLAEWREGKKIRWRVFVNEDEALEDAGLTPLG
jgi:ketosteroid isomerase-like protein